ncbi:MAG: type II toxin-antitoxin system HicA family toxin [Oscillospiraceae bacterium]|nr:type II toxin-antitoxin system HicA family toxin [Oscillospiraceae bacterium]
MGKTEKQKARLQSIPSDYTFTEANSFLVHLGFALSNKGHTSGSRVLYFRKEDGAKIMLHKPHPGDVIPEYAVRQLKQTLADLGEIDE